MERRDLIITALALLLVLGIIFGTAFYLFRFFSKKPSATARNLIPIVTSAPVATNKPGVTQMPVNSQLPGPGATQAALKVFTGSGFRLSYPRTWGLLTCSKSSNFELDPAGGVDQIGVGCDYAMKSVTVLVGPTDCTGTPVTLGTTTFLKTITKVGNDVKYKWCTTNTTPQLEVSHRVSPDDGRGFSTIDYSSQVEEVLKSMRFGGAS